MNTAGDSDTKWIWDEYETSGNWHSIIFATDPSFAKALLRKGIDSMLHGDVNTGKSLLSDYIKATIGFEKRGAGGAYPTRKTRVVRRRHGGYRS